MEKKKLLELAKQLNGLTNDDGTALAAKKVKVVAVSDEGLKVSFLEACESVTEANEEKIPDEIAGAYNELIKEDPREKGKKEPVPEKKKEEKVSDKKKVEKVKEAKPEKKKTEVKKEKVADKKEPKKKEESNKLKIYRVWNKNKKKTIDELNLIVPEIKLSTIKNWVSSWNKEKNLPSGI